MKHSYGRLNKRNIENGKLEIEILKLNLTFSETQVGLNQGCSSAIWCSSTTEVTTLPMIKEGSQQIWLKKREYNLNSLLCLETFLPEPPR